MFEVVGDPKTGESYTSADVARMSLGDLSEDEIEGIRSGAVSDPHLRQVIALAGVFGVAPSYLVDRGNEAFLLDVEIVDALRDETAKAIARESARLDGREKTVILGIVRQFEGVRKDEARGASAGGP